jgi:hypothetical protein
MIHRTAHRYSRKLSTCCDLETNSERLSPRVSRDPKTGGRDGQQRSKAPALAGVPITRHGRSPATVISRVRKSPWAMPFPPGKLLRELLRMLERRGRPQLGRVTYWVAIRGTQRHCCLGVTNMELAVGSRARYRRNDWSTEQRVSTNFTKSHPKPETLTCNSLNSW